MENLKIAVEIFFGRYDVGDMRYYLDCDPDRDPIEYEESYQMYSSLLEFIFEHLHDVGEITCTDDGETRYSDTKNSVEDDIYFFLEIEDLSRKYFKQDLDYD